MRWRKTTPRATDRRVFRRGLCDGPGIGEVILAIIARTCSSLEVGDGWPVRYEGYGTELTCALAD
jgi:hypothetical protein